MTSKTTNKFSLEVRARSADGAGSREGAYVAVGGGSVDRGEVRVRGWTLHEWVKKAEVDSGARAGTPSDIAERLKALERENRELRQANEILRKASAYFAMAEFDRQPKR